MNAERMDRPLRARGRLACMGWAALLLAGCGGGSSPVADATGAATAQIVFMTPIGGAILPGPGAIFEVAVMNLDGSGFRQLTNDGKMKMLPHFSPSATKIAYTRYSVASYGDPRAVMDIAVLDLASGTETVITHDGHDANATWSPDGSRIGYIDAAEASIWSVAVDGSDPIRIASASGRLDDMFFGDLAWSRDDWLLFTVAQNVDGCFKVRTDKIRPDGSQRTQVSDGGPNCTPPGMEQSGDADPGWSADGSIIYSSRGFPWPPSGAPATVTERKLYAFSSDAWYPGKPEIDLSLAAEPNCVEGVPKGSPDGRHILLSRGCFGAGSLVSGIDVTDTAGSYRARLNSGFGPDWNPMTNPP